MRRLTTLHLPFALLRPAYNHGMRIIRLFLTILILVAAFSVVYAVVDELGVLAPESIPTDIPKGAAEAKLDWVYDGDTIEVVFPDGETETVRLTGIDAPETGANNTTKQCYGAESTQHLRSLLPLGTTVWLERDVSDRDQYGRLVRFVWIAEGDSGLLVNHQMLADGYAFARSYGADDSRGDQFWAAATSALDANLGMWESCPEYRGQ